MKKLILLTTVALAIFTGSFESSQAMMSLPPPGWHPLLSIDPTDTNNDNGTPPPPPTSGFIVTGYAAGDGTVPAVAVISDNVAFNNTNFSFGTYAHSVSAIHWPGYHDVYYGEYVFFYLPRPATSNYVFAAEGVWNSLTNISGGMTNVTTATNWTTVTMLAGHQVAVFHVDVSNFTNDPSYWSNTTPITISPSYMTNGLLLDTNFMYSTNSMAVPPMLDPIVFTGNNGVPAPYSGTPITILNWQTSTGFFGAPSLDLVSVEINGTPNSTWDVQAGPGPSPNPGTNSPPWTSFPGPIKLDLNGHGGAVVTNAPSDQLYLRVVKPGNE